MGRFDKDTFGDRQKAYENVFEQFLVPNMPFIIRIDGKAFHSLCKYMKKPFDDLFIETMQQTMFAIAKDIPYCKLGYCQSDEITLVCVMNDYTKNESFYNGRINKINTICASKATKYFNKFFYKNVSNIYKYKEVVEYDIYVDYFFEAEFDCRTFNVPQWDLLNNVIWRQQDATKNSILLLGQSQFTQDELLNKDCSEVMDMLMLQKNINWNDLETCKKRGTCCYKKNKYIESKGKEKKIWYLDLDMPIITEERDFFNSILNK